MAMSSTTLSVLGFALNSWLEGSSQLRNNLINPMVLTRRNETTSNISTSPAPGNQGTRPISRIIRWLRKPERDLEEFEKTIMGLIDVSTAFVILKIFGSGPLLPFLLNPLTVVLPLPLRFSIDSVHWSHVALTSLALSCIHEAERVSVAAGIKLWRDQKKEQSGFHIYDVVARGDDRQPKDVASHVDEDECLICSGVGFDAPLSDSVTSLSSTPSPSLGPLEAFCVNAPQKHLMHRECFLAWSKAYREQRPWHSQPMIMLNRIGEPLSAPGENEWLRASAILAAAGLEHLEDMLCLPPVDDIWVADIRDARRGDHQHDVSVFALQPGVSNIRGGLLGTLVSKAPPCPGCRSAVKLCFTQSLRIATQLSSQDGGWYSRLLRVWMQAWRQLVTGRTILFKMATQVMFVAALVSMLKVKSSRGAKSWIAQVA